MKTIINNIATFLLVLACLINLHGNSYAMGERSEISALEERCSSKNTAEKHYVIKRGILTQADNFGGIPGDCWPSPENPCESHIPINVAQLAFTMSNGEEFIFGGSGLKPELDRFLSTLTVGKPYAACISVYLSGNKRLRYSLMNFEDITQLK